MSNRNNKMDGVVNVKLLGGNSSQKWQNTRVWGEMHGGNRYEVIGMRYEVTALKAPTERHPVAHDAVMGHPHDEVVRIRHITHPQTTPTIPFL